MKFTRPETNLFINAYLGITLFFLMVSSFINVSHIIFLFIFFVPLIIFVFKFSSLRILMEASIYLVLIFGTIFFTFRYFRSLFFPPEINENKIVGYAQYFGYPFHFDTLLFFIFMIIPVLMFFYILFKRKNRK